MGKYLDAQSSILSVFNSISWKKEAIPTFPTNFLLVNPGNQYIRVSIIASGIGINTDSTSGVLHVDIFTPAGNGPKAGATIADKLDLYLQGKTVEVEVGKAVQFSLSSFSPTAIDSDNPSLFKSVYQIPFSLFGAI